MNKRQRKKWLKKNQQYISAHELWNLDVHLAKYIETRLIEFKKRNVYSYPATLDSSEDWDAIIDEMIKGFQYAQKDVWDIYEIDISSKDELHAALKEYNDVVERGLRLFAEYFLDLWM